MNVDVKKLQAMLDASLESVAYRQDRYPTGGIVESDVRFDNGFVYGKGKTCYPRNVLAEPLVFFGMADRLRRSIEFWRLCQDTDGSWGGSYFIDKPEPCRGRGKLQTDTTGYVLHHCFVYYNHSKDKNWLNEHWEMIEKGADYLTSLVNDEFGMIPGNEEAIIREQYGEVNWPEGYHAHINSACERGLRVAAKMAQDIDKQAQARKYLTAADTIKYNIFQRLWDDNDKRMLFGINLRGEPYRAAMWFSLMPWYLNCTWDEKAHSTFYYLWDKFYDKDPLIRHSYWSNDFTELAEGRESYHSRYSGAGPYIGVSAAIAEMLLWDGNEKLAEDQINLITQYTDESNLICEHINTLHPGSEGSLKVYPEKPYAVDRGNGMHMSFFLHLAIELCKRGIIEKPANAY
ncbi:MAG: hypothetical protein J7L99_03195 [Planctomycetes bacterium]|nr:hypothetical protein [Planctomycetota bacterium]